MQYRHFLSTGYPHPMRFRWAPGAQTLLSSYFPGPAELLTNYVIHLHGINITFIDELRTDWNVFGKTISIFWEPCVPLVRAQEKRHIRPKSRCANRPRCFRRPTASCRRQGGRPLPHHFTPIHFPVLFPTIQSNTHTHISKVCPTKGCH